MDPAAYSLRDLWWMAGGRWQAEFGAVLAGIGTAFAGKEARAEIGEPNPYRGTGRPEVPAEVAEADSRIAWQVLGDGLRHMVGGG